MQPPTGENAPALTIRFQAVRATALCSGCMPEPAAPVDPEQALLEALAAGGPLALLGERNPVALVQSAAARSGRSLDWVDARRLTTQPFDRLVRGWWDGVEWNPGGLVRAMTSGGVFLISNVQALPDDLRQRIGRLLLTGKVPLTGPVLTSDQVIAGHPATSYVLHVDDHQPVLLQVYTLIKRFPVRIRADAAGPPPVARR